MESKEYLLEVSKKIQYYFDTRQNTIKYIRKNKITDLNLQTNLMVVGAVWAAHKLDDTLTEDTMLTVFGLESNNTDPTKEIYGLHPNHQHLTLKEILDFTVESF